MARPDDATSEANDGERAAAAGGSSPEGGGPLSIDSLAPAESGVVTEVGEPTPDRHAIVERVKTILVGRLRDLQDQSVLHSVSLIAFFAWVGLGADGLSSSCYGPAEAFHSLFHEGAGGQATDFTFLALFLAAATIVTVLVISSCYSHIVEEFPSGGGGYLVASKLLGRRVGAVSGCALLVDYVLTITTSIAAAGDALFGLMGPAWSPWKLWAEAAAIGVLIVLNLRGIKESILVLMPIFLVFLLMHAVLIFGTIGLNVTQLDDVVVEVSGGVQKGLADPAVGLFGMLSMFLYAYSLGAGTYTGIEAVSNSMQVMREPRVATGQRTMLYMALSLAITAGGLILGYLLLGIRPAADKTMNLLLTERFLGELGLGGGFVGEAFVLVTILSEGLLLVVAAQAGFIGGPRMLANMAHDSWIPHWFANLSERLATHNGIFLMGLSALAALVYTRGNVSTLLIMYSINVFLTFSLSMLGMCRHWWRLRGQHALWRRRLALFACGAVLCLSILAVTVLEKFHLGGWVTLAVTSLCVGACLLTNGYYERIVERVSRLNQTLGKPTVSNEPVTTEPDPNLPAAAVLVGGYGGLGIHTMLNAVRFAPGHFKSVVFLSVGVVDSGNFKGAGGVDDLRRHTEESLLQYVELARRLGLPAKAYAAVGTDVVDELEGLCMLIARQFPKAIFFAGQLMFQKDTWYQRLFHNQTAYSLQRRLQWDGVPMVILPTRVR